jgi:hypothetical protein
MTPAYLALLSCLTDDELLTETEAKIWLSSQPATSLLSESHEQRAACAQECARRNGNLYAVAEQRAAQGWPSDEFFSGAE